MTLERSLESLDGVLQFLRQAVAMGDSDLNRLKLPLVRCGKADRDFEAVIVKCAVRSDGSLFCLVLILIAPSEMMPFLCWQ